MLICFSNVVFSCLTRVLLFDDSEPGFDVLLLERIGDKIWEYTEKTYSSWVIYSLLQSTATKDAVRFVCECERWEALGAQYVRFSQNLLSVALLLLCLSLCSCVLFLPLWTIYRWESSRFLCCSTTPSFHESWNLRRGYSPSHLILCPSRIVLNQLRLHSTVGRPHLLGLIRPTVSIADTNLFPFSALLLPNGIFSE